MASLLSTEEVKKIETPQLEQMIVAWRGSDMNKDDIKLFPLTVTGIQIHTSYVEVSCINSGLIGDTTFQSSELYQYCQDNEKETISLLLIYHNPVDNTKVTNQVDVEANEILNATLTSCFNINLLPIIKYRFKRV